MGEKKLHPFTESENHRMVQVGRDLCGSSSLTPLLKQGHLQQAAQHLVQVGLEYLQRMRIYSLPVLRHSQSEGDRNWVQPSREIFWPVLCPHLLPATSACGSHLTLQRNAKFHSGPSPGTPQAPAHQQQPLPFGSWPLLVQRYKNVGGQVHLLSYVPEKHNPLIHLSVSIVSETLQHQEHFFTVTWTPTSEHTHQLLSTSAIFQTILKQQQWMQNTSKIQIIRQNVALMGGAFDQYGSKHPPP